MSVITLENSETLPVGMPGDQECLIEKLCTTDTTSLRGRRLFLPDIVNLEYGENGKLKAMELLCKKCSLGIMTRAAINGQVEARAISSESCREGLGNLVGENWAPC